MIEDGVVPGAAARPQVRPRHPLLGPRRRAAPAAGRPRRAAPDGARGAAVPRPRRDLGVRRRGDLHRGSVRVGLALVPRRRRVEGREGHHDPGRARRPGRPAAGAEAVRGGAAADHRHRPLGRRPLPLRLLLGNRRAQAVRRVRPGATRARSARCGSAGSSTAPPHPAAPDMPLAGGPQMVEVSRDGRRVYFTNSLYGAWDDQFYPDGVGAWMAKLDADPGRRAEHRRAVLPARRRVPRPARRTRSGCRAATPRPTPTATADRPGREPPDASAIMVGMAYDEDLANRIRELIADEPDLTEQRMFGGWPSSSVGTCRSRSAAGAACSCAATTTRPTRSSPSRTPPRWSWAGARRAGGCGWSRGREDEAPAPALGDTRRRVRALAATKR